MKFSVIVPVYNRPDEMAELLESLAAQSYNDFEVVVVEDGSALSSEDVVNRYNDRLTVSYYKIPNGGPGLARNYGATKASGEYLIFLDSDCIIPGQYFEAVDNELKTTGADAFGGPDKASSAFTKIQKAINYAMTSFFTTGGIRGGKKELDKFYPRSFNLGIRKNAFEKLGGFSSMRFGEDIDLSIRIYKSGYKVRLFRSAWVYHKRRTGWKKFFKQVFNSGTARIHLYKKYPDSLKLVHLLPAAFTVAVLVFIAGTAFCLWSILPLIVYILLIFCDAAIQNKSLTIGALSVIASFIQLTGYGCGFFSGVWNGLILNKKEFSAFKNTFYK